MQLKPRYEGPPIIRFDLPLADPSVPLVRQRRRLAETLSTFDGEQWSSATRCERWSTKDVVAHLAGTNRFWTASIRSGLDGNPTRLLSSFDPATTPAALIEAVGDTEPEEVLGQLVESNDVLASTVCGLDTDAWLMPAEAPPGHVAIQALALHALWDSWIHERDILLPLGLEPEEEGDEVSGCLLYASALGPAFLAMNGSDRLDTLAVAATDLGVRILVDVGPSVVVRDGIAPEGCAALEGSGVDLVESLSCRGNPPRLAETDQWMLEGLAVVFDLVP